MKKIIYIAFVLLMWGCTEVIELDIEQVPPVFVIEGMVTNQSKRHSVRITKSIGFYEEGPAPAVSGAQILVTDSDGNEFLYSESETAGTYVSNDAFEGMPGRTYTLKVYVENQTFIAKDSLRSIQNIDKFVWRFAIDKFLYEDRIDDPKYKGYFFEVLLTTREPQETKDYYFFKVYRNDSLQTNEGQSIYFADDAVIGEMIEDFPGPVYYRYLDTTRFEVYSMTPEAFKYWNDTQSNIMNDGGMFGSVPANAYTNIQGKGVIGFFQTSSVVADSLVVGDSTRIHEDSPPFPFQ